MARIFIIGFEVASNSLADNYPLTGGSPTAGYAPGRCGCGRAYAVARPASSYYVMGGSPASTQYVSQWERFYLRVRRIPTTGSCRVWSNFTDLGGQSLRLNLKTDGTLEFLNVARVLGTTTALTLDQWYRIEIRSTCNTQAFAAPDPPLDDNSVAELKIDGVSVINVTPTNNGVSLLGIATRNAKIYRSYLGAEGVLADAEFDLDDWVGDDTAYPGAGQVTVIRPNGAGTYQEFTGDWRRVAPLPGSVSPIADGITSTTGSARATYTVESFASRGITGTINAVQVNAFVRTGVTIPALNFRVNGSDNWANVLAGGNDVFTARLITAPAVAYTDTVEIGYRKDASATANYVNHLSLLVDHDTPDPPASTDGTIRIATGTYTGNGTGQTVALDFEPDFIMIRRIGAVGIGLIWTSGMGDRGGYATGTDGMGIQGASTRLPLVKPNGFEVAKDLETNTSGASYWFMAVRDRTQRMMATGALFPPSIDNLNVPLRVSDFVPETLFVFEQFNTGSTGDVYFRGPAHIGDLSSIMSAGTGAPVADAIQSIGTGTFQLGTILTTSTGQRSYLGFKTGSFVQNRLLAVTSYVGTGVGVGVTRNISLNLGGRTPDFILIVPHNAGGNRYFRTNANAAGDAQNWRSGAVQPTYAINAVTGDQATVGYLLDTLGVTFTVFALSVGEDAPSLPEETFPDSWSGDTVPLLWAELALDTGTQVYAKVDLPDPATYYGGFKESRILTAGAIKRALSDRMGNYESAQFSLNLSDLDRRIRGFLSSSASKWIMNRFVTLRMISDANRRLLRTPRVVGIGYLRDYAPNSPLSFSLTCEDYLALFVGLGQNEKQIPKRTITRTDFPDCPTAQIGKPVPVCYGRLTGVVASTAQPPTIIPSPGGFGNDGGWIAGYGTLQPPCTATPPTSVTVAASASTPGVDVDVPNAEYGVIVTSVDAGGLESDPYPFSWEQAGVGRGSWPAGVPKVTVTAGQKVDVSWSGATGASKYRVYIGWYYYGGRFTQMIEVTAPTVSCSFTLNPPWQTPVDTTNITPGAALIQFGMFATYAVSAIFADGSETAKSVHVFGRSGPYKRPVRIDWNAVAGATSYRIYRRPHLGADWDRYWDVTTTYFLDDHADTGAIMIEQNQETVGVVPTIHVGKTDVSGFKWDTFLVCGHAVKSIEAIYAGTAKQEAGTYGVTWLVPGTASWTAAGFANPYLDRNGRRYTVILGRGPAASEAAAGNADAAITVNLLGVEAVGNGSGDLIEDGFTQYLHAMRNWVLQDYQGGAWFTTGPVWPDSFGLGTTEVLDDASFTAASAVAATRISGGYKGAFMLGADGKQDPVRTWVQRFNLSLDAFTGFSRKSQFFVRLIDTSSGVLTGSRQFTQVHDIVADSWKVTDKPADLENVVVYVFGRDYAKGGGWRFDAREVSDATSITNFLQEKRSQTIELWMIPATSAGQALDVASRRLLRTKETPRTVTFTTGLQAINVELGDVIRVTHLEGIGPNGWTDRAIFVTRHELDPDKLTITLEGIDVDRLFEGAYILGNESTLAATWGSAGATDRTYGYLGNETTEQFGDGSAIKRLR